MFNTVMENIKRINHNMVMKAVALFMIITAARAAPTPMPTTIERWQDPCGGTSIVGNLQPSGTTRAPPAVIAVNPATKDELARQILKLKDNLNSLLELIKVKRVHSPSTRAKLETSPSLGQFVTIKSEEQAAADASESKLSTYISDYSECAKIAIFLSAMKSKENEDVFSSKISDVEEDLYPVLCSLKGVIESNYGSIESQDEGSVVNPRYHKNTIEARRHNMDYAYIYKAAMLVESLEVQYLLLRDHY